MRTQDVAESELLMEALRARRNEVQVMRPAARIRLAEPVHFVGAIRGVYVAEPAEGRKAGA